MRILKLTAENIKRLKAVEITPDGNTVVIAGANGAGKTSVLDAIWFALGGGPAQKETSRVIRDGEKGARVTLDLGDLIVTRTWSGEKTTLAVTSREGAKFSSPQSMLDELVGRLSFDPLAFAQQDSKTQLAALMELVELPFDPAELAAKRAGIYEERTVAGREFKALEGKVAGVSIPTDLPDEEISTASILDEQAAHQRAISAFKAASDRLTAAREDIGHKEALMLEAEERLHRMRLDLEAAHAELDEARLATDGAPLPPEIDFGARLAKIEQTNLSIRDARIFRSATAEVRDAKLNVESLTQAIEDLDVYRSKAVAEASMPVEGLAFDDEGVTYGGIPFKQCSSAERLRVSVAMAIAMNPKLRVIRITDGSLLDSENMALISEMAEKHDAQIWIERVDESGEVGIFIEDGMVVEVMANA